MDTLLNATKTDAGIEPVDVDKIISHIKVPEKYQDTYERSIIFGMRLMFGKETYKTMFLKQLEDKQSLDRNLIQGIYSLVMLMKYRLGDFRKDDDGNFVVTGDVKPAIPGVVLIPAAVVLLLKAFGHLQDMNYPGTTKDVLGIAWHGVIEEILKVAGVSVQQIPEIMKKYASEIEKEVSNAAT